MTCLYRIRSDVKARCYIAIEKMQILKNMEKLNKEEQRLIMYDYSGIITRECYEKI